MAFAYGLAFLVLSHHLLLLHSALEQDENTRQPTCPKSFNCGIHSNISFPFTNNTYHQCGLCTIHNCDESVQKIQLWTEAKRYDLKKWVREDEIVIYDPELENLLKTQNCESFNHFSLPNSPSIFFRVPVTITLFKCTKSPELDKQTEEFFRGNLSYRGCPDYNIYYSYPNNLYPSLPLPTNCLEIHMPLLLPNNIPSNPQEELFPLLTAEFLLEYQVSDRCHDCHSGGGLCQLDKKNKFRCSNVKGDHKTTVILATVIPGAGVSIICLVLFIFWRRHKLGVTSYFLSRNTSSVPSSKADLEGGSVFFGVPVFSYSELEEATENFDPSKELGDGGFGTVYYGKLRDGREVAVKRLYENNYKRVEQFMNEIKILTCLRHHNLVTLYGCTSRHSRELLLVYEYISNGTVADHLHGDRAEPFSLTWPIRMNIAIETATALVYLHATEIVHRDVKTNNILLDSNFCVKVADFGLSRLFPINVTHVSTAPQGTPGYVDPDYHQCYQLTDKSDVYSFGVVLIELISSLPAVDISRHRHEINLASLAKNRIQKCALNELVDPNLGFDSDDSVKRMTTSVAELSFRCLQHEKEMRPTMVEVLEVLKEIQADQEGKDGNSVDFKFRLPLSPENDEVVFLKNNTTNFSFPSSLPSYFTKEEEGRLTSSA